jgi:hypothetical protein
MKELKTKDEGVVPSAPHPRRGSVAGILICASLSTLALAMGIGLWDYAESIRSKRLAKR